MKVDRRIAIVATCVMAASLSQCKSSATAPYDTRTYSVTATPVTVPAVPTAPIVISTNDPNSHVQVTLPVAALQAIVAAAGGPATLAMTDVAPPDFSTLPSGEGAFISSRPLTVLEFTITPTTASSSAIGRARVSAISAQSNARSTLSFGTVTLSQVSFSITLPSGTSCSSPFLYEILASGASLLSNTTLTATAGPPEVISGSTTQLAFNNLSALVAFECPSATVSGGSGGSN